MAITITKVSGDLRHVIDDNFALSFSATTDTPIFDDSDPPIQIDTAVMTSLVITLSHQESPNLISINNGVTSCSLSGKYTQRTFPQSSMTYALKGSNAPITLINFDMDNIPPNPSAIELFSIQGSPINLKIVTVSVKGIDSAGVQKTVSYTLTIENNYNKVKNYISQVYP
jgi:hypothetical protein